MRSESTSADNTALDWEHQGAVELRSAAQKFDFFQAIRRVESLATELPPVGHAQQARQEALRIRQTAALDFAPATIDRVDQGHDGRALLSQRCFGLLGPAGPLPLHMTQQVRDRAGHDKDHTLESFLSLFQHRMATLFYRAWRSSRGAIQRDRPDHDRFASYLGALSGGKPVKQQDRMHRSMPDRVKRSETRWHFSGRYGSSHRNAEGLEAVVSAAVGANTRVTTFVLRQLRLQPEDRTVLSTEATTRGRGGRLGRSAVLGRQVADRRSMIGMRIGPIDFQRFKRLLPGGSFHQELRELIRSYIDPGLDCRVQLVLNHQTVPRMSLGRQGILGRSAWVRSKPPQQDVGDCEFLI